MTKDREMAKFQHNAKKVNGAGNTPSCTAVRRRGPNDDSLNQLVRRVSGKSGISDPLGCAILELGDGRTVHEVVEAIYNEELRKGAWLVDIGLWKSLFDRSVVETIGELARQGLICLEPSHEEGSNDMPATTRKKRERSKARKAGLQRHEESGNGRPIGINNPRKREEVTVGVAVAAQDDLRLVTQQPDHDGSQRVVRPNGAIHPGTRQEPVSNGESAFAAEVPRGLRGLGQGVIGAVNNLWKRTAGSIRR